MDALHRPAEVAAELKIHASTLSLWSRRFADFLSDAAALRPGTDGVRPAQRRYADADVKLLRRVDALLRVERLDYEQIARRLQEEGTAPRTPEEPEQPDPTEELAGTVADLRGLVDSQQELLSEQADMMDDLLRYVMELRGRVDALDKANQQLGRSLQESVRRVAAVERENRAIWQRMLQPWWKRQRWLRRLIGAQ